MARTQVRYVLFANLIIWLYLTAGSHSNEVVSLPISLNADAYRQNLRELIPQNRLAQSKAAESVSKYDEDHSNIDLDKLNELHQYEVLPAAQADHGAASYVRDGGFQSVADSLDRLFPKMLRNNGYYNRDHQFERKRDTRRMGVLKEDKDYSFVGLPINKFSARQQQQLQQLQLQRGINKLRDMLMIKASQYRLPNENAELGYGNNNNDLDELSQVNLPPLGYKSNENNNNETYEDPTSKNRDKRRRCKVDPNLGVKNPSSCDTDAYFGAADYSMRDVWDSAGRRR